MQDNCYEFTDQPTIVVERCKAVHIKEEHGLLFAYICHNEQRIGGLTCGKHYGHAKVDRKCKTRIFDEREIFDFCPVCKPEKVIITFIQNPYF